VVDGDVFCFVHKGHGLFCLFAPQSKPTHTINQNTINKPNQTKGCLTLQLLPRALTPWTDALDLARCAGVDDAWLGAAAVCRGLRVLDISNCNLVRRLLLVFSPVGCCCLLCLFGLQHGLKGFDTANHQPKTKPHKRSRATD
jgi:hypothetical protein